MKNNLSNKKIFKGPLQSIAINLNNYILICEYEKRGNDFFDVIFVNNGKEIFLGRFNKEYSKVNAKYCNGKILIYYDKVIGNKISAIVKVLSLYDIVDDTFYSVSEAEAIELFDSNLSSLYLKNKDNLIVREDVAKKTKYKKFKN